MHDLWRDGRLQLDGSYEPRIKTIDGVQYDIANLPFVELPEALRASNMSAAHAACSSVERALVDGMDLRSSDCIEWASERQHVNWIAENEAWADTALLVEYAALSEVEKEKDRVFVRLAVRAYTDFANSLYTSLPIDDRRGKSEEQFLQELARCAGEMRSEGRVERDVNLVELDERAMKVNLRTRML
jgi:hypothetical protein